MLAVSRSRPLRLPKALLLVLVIAVAPILLGGCAHRFSGSVLDPPAPAPDFVLTDHEGRPFRLSELQGKVVLLYFGYTSCPDICPVDVARLAAVRRALGNDAQDLRVLFVTVDPERDSAEVIRDYLARFDPTFTGLRGTPEELRQVYKSYGIYAEKRALPGSALGYVVDHTATVMLVDRGGRWRALFDHDLSAEEVTGDVRFFLRERGAS